MAVIFVEGFDAYNGVGGATATSVGAGVRWSVSSNVSITSATPYNIGQAVSISFNPTLSSKTITTPLNSTYTQGTVGLAFFTSTAPNSTCEIVVFYLGTPAPAGRQFSLSLLGSGALAIATGTATIPTVIYTTTNVISANTWNYIELEFTIADSAAINIYVNGALFGSAVGLDTKTQASDGYNIIGFGTTSGSSFGFVGSFDDIYITDTTTRLGEQRVATVVPASDGTPSQWAASGGAVAPYTMVDEAQCNGDTDYIYDGTLGDRAVFNMASTGATPVSVSAVQLGTFSRKTDSGTRSIQLQYVDGSGTAYSSSDLALASGYQRQLNILNNNPATSTVWSPTAVNNLKVGVRISV